MFKTIAVALSFVLVGCTSVLKEEVVQETQTEVVDINALCPEGPTYPETGKPAEVCNLIVPKIIVCPSQEVIRNLANTHENRKDAAVLLVEGGVCAVGSYLAVIDVVKPDVISEHEGAPITINILKVMSISKEEGYALYFYQVNTI